jgi:hypothetical protein
MQSREQKSQKLLSILLLTTLHVIETGQAPDGIVDILRGERVAPLLQLFVFQTKTQLLDGCCRVDQLEVAHEHDSTHD